MPLKIKHTLVVLDLETTGTWIEKDKIVEIAMIKQTTDGKTETYLKRCNPGIPIPKEVSEIINITDEDVKDELPFKKIAEEVVTFMGDADLAGFNHERFDLPLLQRELLEAGIPFEWQSRKCFDAQRIFHHHERRDLSAAYSFYCDKDLKNAHSALADTQATFEILESQAQKYGNGKSLDFFDETEYRPSTASFYGTGRKFRWWNNELYPMFGKYARKWSLKQIAQKDSGYLKWILSADFSEEVKNLAQDALEGRFPSKSS